MVDETKSYWQVKSSAKFLKLRSDERVARGENLWAFLAWENSSFSNVALRTINCCHNPIGTFR